MKTFPPYRDSEEFNLLNDEERIFSNLTKIKK